MGVTLYHINLNRYCQNLCEMLDGHDVSKLALHYFYLSLFFLLNSTRLQGIVVSTYQLFSVSDCLFYFFS